MTTTERVFDCLKYLGLVPRYDDNNNIRFMYQMVDFLYYNNDSDEAFINLTMIGFYKVTDDNRLAVFEAMNTVNETTKVVKLTISRDNWVWAGTEIMMDSTPELDDVLPRLLRILIVAKDKFLKEIG